MHFKTIVIAMTWRVAKVQHMVYSETQGERTSTLEVVHEASAESRYRSVCVGVGVVVNKPHPQGVTYLKPISL